MRASPKIPSAVYRNLISIAEFDAGEKVKTMVTDHGVTIRVLALNRCTREIFMSGRSVALLEMDPEQYR